MSASLTTLPLPSIVGIAYLTILTAELVGDKATYTISALALRFPLHTIVAGMAAAFASKMLVAVSLGASIMRIPSRWIATLSAAAFFISAMVIWRDQLPGSSEPNAVPTDRRPGRITCFLALFIPEWGDPGQVAAAALALQTHSVLAPWLGGTLALATKGSLALALGVSLRERLPRATLRLFSSVSCCVLGVVALAAVFVH